MCMGGGSSTPATAAPAPAAPVQMEEVRAPRLGESEDVKKKKAQEGKRDLRVPLGAADAETVGAGISSGLNI